MPRGGAHFAASEVARVLSHYDIGVIDQAKPLTAGNRRAPKMVIVSDKGKFLLKRRPRGKDDLYRVAFAHAVHGHLAEEAFPVASLVVTRDAENTMLQLAGHIYEVFEFVSGSRYDGSPEATFDTGKQLARFHKYLAGCSIIWTAPGPGLLRFSGLGRRRIPGHGNDVIDPGRVFLQSACNLALKFGSPCLLLALLMAEC